MTREQYLLFATASLLALALSGPAMAQALPSDVATRVGHAAKWVSDYTPQQYAEGLKTWDVIWWNQPGTKQGGPNKLHFPTGTFSGAYTTINRVRAPAGYIGQTRGIASCGEPDGGCPLSWFD